MEGGECHYTNVNKTLHTYAFYLERVSLAFHFLQLSCAMDNREFELLEIH